MFDKICTKKGYITRFQNFYLTCNKIEGNKPDVNDSRENPPLTVQNASRKPQRAVWF